MTTHTSPLVQPLLALIAYPADRRVTPVRPPTTTIPPPTDGQWVLLQDISNFGASFQTMLSSEPYTNTGSSLVNSAFVPSTASDGAGILVGQFTAPWNTTLVEPIQMRVTFNTWEETAPSPGAGDLWNRAYISYGNAGVAENNAAPPTTSFSGSPITLQTNFSGGYIAPTAHISLVVDRGLIQTSTFESPSGLSGGETHIECTVEVLYNSVWTNIFDLPTGSLGPLQGSLTRVGNTIVSTLPYDAGSSFGSVELTIPGNAETLDFRYTIIEYSEWYTSNTGEVYRGLTPPTFMAYGVDTATVSGELPTTYPTSPESTLATVWPAGTYVTTTSPSNTLESFNNKTIFVGISCSDYEDPVAANISVNFDMRVEFFLSQPPSEF